jgi:PhnB protein
MSDTPIETTIAPWLTVRNGAHAVEYYTAGFGAVEAYRLEDDAGRIVVAQLKVDGAPFWVQEDAEAEPASGVEGSVRMSSVRMILTVADPDALLERALTAGATEVVPVGDAHGWRTGRVRDPFGYDWEFARPLGSGR